MREKVRKACVRSHTGTVDRFFLFEKESENMCGRVCVHFSMYVNAVTIHSISFFFMLRGHHHHHSNNMVVVAILSSYSYSSGNQLRVVGAIFSSHALLFSLSLFDSTICPELKKRGRQEAEMHKRQCDRWSIEYPFQIFSCVYV
jgi:hypothetical protein